MRPGEVCRLTWGELDRTAVVWIYRPSQHKTRHRGKTRAVAIGPHGQALLRTFLAGRVPAAAGVDALDLTDPATRARAAALFDVSHRPSDACLLRDHSRPAVPVVGTVLDPGAVVFDPARD
jgi:hypothetical protein